MTRRTPAMRRALALAFVVGTASAAILHIATVCLAGWLAPETSSLRSAISDLGRAGEPHAALVNWGGLAVPGLLVLAAGGAGAGLLVEARLGLGLIAFAGFELLVAGLEPFPSPVHLVAVLSAATAATAGLVLFSDWASVRLGDRRWRIAGVASALLVAVTTGMIALHLAVGWPRAELWLGLLQRVASFAALTWLALCAGSLARQGRLDARND